jgi:hypothetical protein
MQLEFFGILNVCLLSEKLKDQPQPSVRLIWVLAVLFLGKEAGKSCFGVPHVMRRSESRGDILADSSSWRGDCVCRSNTTEPIRIVRQTPFTGSGMDFFLPLLLRDIRVTGIIILTL